MQGKCLLRLFFMVSCLFSTSLYAFSGFLSPTDGWYVEGAGGVAYLSSMNYPSGTTADHTGGAGTVNVGYKFFPYLGSEMGYSFFSTNDVKNSSGTVISSNSHYAYYLAVRGIYPFPLTGLEGFARLGGGRMNTDITIKNASAASAVGLNRGGKKSAMGLLAGFGAQYYFLPQVAGVLAWQVTEGDNRTGTENLFSIGLSAIFS